MMRLTKGCALAAVLTLGLLSQASPAAARPAYATELDRRCALEGRTPPNPAALARAGAALGDCALCHSGRNPSGGNVTPDGFAFLSGNLDPFCLASIANGAPVLDPIGSRQVDVGVPLVVSLHATDPDPDTLGFSAAPVPDGAVFSDAGNGTASLTWTPTAAQTGGHTVAFTVSDGALSDAETIVISVGAVDAPPVLDPIGDQLVDLGSPLSLAFSANDPEGGPLVFSAEGVPASATFVDAGDGTASLSWVADAVGTHPVTVTVVDAAMPPGAASESFAITVRDPNALGPEVLQAHWSERAQKLGVRGIGAVPRGVVELLDAGTGASLGARRANGEGGFRGWLRPFLAPCEVQASADGVLGAVLPVADAPADCGQRMLTRVRRLEWSCEKRELRLEGERAAIGGTVQVLDPDQDGLVLGEATPDRKGRFRARLALANSPARVQLRALAGSGAWDLEPLSVGVRGACAGDDDDGGDDDGEDANDDDGDDDGGSDGTGTGSGEDPDEHGTPGGSDDDSSGSDGGASGGDGEDGDDGEDEREDDDDRGEGGDRDDDHESEDD